MNAFFAWRTVDDIELCPITTYSYGTTHDSTGISDWASLHEDLEVTVIIQPDDAVPEIDDFLMSGERAAWVIRWRCDDKFTGTSNVYENVQGHSLILKCIVPKGYCHSSIIIECNLVAVNNNPSFSYWQRPTGSILAAETILDRTNIGRGNIFPLIDYAGDSTALFHWDFYSLDDLEIDISSGVVALIDINHPFNAIWAENPKAEGLKIIMLIQGFARKAFNPGVFDQLEEKELREEKWRNGSLGASFISLLKRICSDLGVAQIRSLKEIYMAHPELIDESIFRLFTESINKRTNV